jgi:hypothetical protein
MAREPDTSSVECVREVQRVDARRPSPVLALVNCLDALPPDALALKRLELLQVAAGPLSDAERDASGRALAAWLLEGSLDPSTRTRVAEVLLRFGYPWALYLEAVDVRPSRRTPRRLRRRAWVLAVVMAAVSAFALALVKPTQPGDLATQEAVPTAPTSDQGRPSRVDVAVKPPPPVVTSVHDTPLPPTRRLPTRTEPLVTPATLSELARNEACFTSDPTRLDCILEAATTSALQSQAPFVSTSADRSRQTREWLAWQAQVGAHEQRARALYRRFLSIAPAGNRMAPVIVRALRRDGDWVEWESGAKALEELELIGQSCASWDAGCLAHVEHGWRQRAQRTHHPDDVKAAAAASARRAEAEALVKQGATAVQAGPRSVIVPGAPLTRSGEGGGMLSQFEATPRRLP